jgi:hypothetical protein
MTLIQHELRLLPHLSLSLPFPSHEALAERCRCFLKEPDMLQATEKHLEKIVARVEVKVELLPESGQEWPCESGETMSKRPRRNHSPAFKAKVASPPSRAR